MRRFPLVTPAQRHHLLRLKTEFDAACADVDDFSDRTSTAFQVAQDRYRTWIKAIDAAALSLLSDLEAFASSDAEPSRTGETANAPISLVEPIRAGDVDHVFAELDDLLQTRAMVTEGEEDTIDLFGPPPSS